MSRLAILGGTPVRTEPFPAYQTIGEEEKRGVLEVMDTGVLSKFLGCWHPDFYGGPKILEVERAWASAVNARHAISVNSNTSGLFAAIGAAGVGPGDEVIVSPYTMSASAACIVGWGGVPVFADIEADTFCLDPEAVLASVTPRTKAVVTVDLLGHPAEHEPLMAMAEARGITIIEDCAQAPLAMDGKKFAGTLGHIGVFSLNYHKHIHSGEGGIITTNDDRLAERLQLIRNHGEAVVDDMGVSELANIVGQNYRMTEIEAAIAAEQLKKLPALLDPWIANAEETSAFLAQYPGVTPPRVRKGCRHVYYVHASKWDAAVTGVSRDRFVQALRAELPETFGREGEGPLVSGGYVRPLYLQSLYQKRTVSRCSFNCPRYTGSVSYKKGICPVAETMHYEQLFAHEYMKPHLTAADRQAFYDAFDKVHRQRDLLR